MKQSRFSEEQIKRLFSKSYLRIWIMTYSQITLSFTYHTVSYCTPSAHEGF